MQKDKIILTQNFNINRMNTHLNKICFAIKMIINSKLKKIMNKYTSQEDNRFLTNLTKV